MDIREILRTEIKDFEAYLPGKPIEEVQRELKLKKVVKLASNENALGTSPKVVQALKGKLGNLYRYPEGPGTYLRRALAKFWKVKESQVILGAGSDELIEILGKTFFKRSSEFFDNKVRTIKNADDEISEGTKYSFGLG